MLALETEEQIHCVGVASASDLRDYGGFLRAPVLEPFSGRHVDPDTIKRCRRGDEEATVVLITPFEIRSCSGILITPRHVPDGSKT